MRFPFVFLLLSLSVSACVNPAEQQARAAQQEAADNAECVRLGFPQGTPDYGDCRLRLREMRLKERLANRPIYVDPYFGPRFTYPYY